MTEFNDNSSERDLGYEFTIFTDDVPVQEPVTGPIFEGDVLGPDETINLRPEEADDLPGETVGVGGFTFVDDDPEPEVTPPASYPTPPQVSREASKPPKIPRQKTPKPPKTPKAPRAHRPVDLAANERWRKRMTATAAITFGALSVGSVLAFTPWTSLLPNEGSVAVAPPSNDARPTIPAVPSTESPTIPTVPFPTMSEPPAPLPTVTVTAVETATATTTATATVTPQPSETPSETVPVETPTEAAPTETIPTETIPTETIPTETAPTEDPSTTPAPTSQTVVIGASSTDRGGIFRQGVSQWWNQLWHRGESQPDINSVRQAVIDQLRAKGFSVVDASVDPSPDQAAFGLTFDTGRDTTIAYTRNNADRVGECVVEQTANTFKDQLEFTIPNLQGQIRLREKGGNPFSVSGSVPSLELALDSRQGSTADIAGAISDAVITTANESETNLQACESAR
jgi:hypothetical protein